jgi:hypothetical protein
MSALELFYNVTVIKMLIAHKFSARSCVWINRSYIKLILALT